MKKTLLSIIACLMLATGSLHAKSLVLTLSDGTLVYYLLGGETNPMMRFTDGKITVDTDEYSISGIKNFYISEEDDPNAIESLRSDKNNAKFQNNTLIVKSGASKSVKVYTMSGAEVEADINTTGKMTSVGIGNLPKGAYVIKIGNSSFKVLKK